MKTARNILTSAAGWGIACLLGLLIHFSLAVSAQENGEDPVGLTEYELACMPCHGLDGKGDGPKARTLTMMPADLTQIKARNGGVFPARAIYDMIDGRGVIPAHGKRDMPVWGERYRKTGDEGEDPAAVDKRARELIEALVGYLESIQQN
ncbi:MAG: c-type cytochrome [Deltaproteobacteria bacterium]